MGRQQQHQPLAGSSTASPRPRPRRRLMALAAAAASFVLVSCLFAVPGSGGGGATRGVLDGVASTFSEETSIRTGQLVQDDDDDDAGLLDGCRHVYLDVGSNVGIQVRKLYEPHLYPDAKVHPVYEKIFGNKTLKKDLSSICSVGFEPNPSHTKRLEELQDAYNACGWRVKFYTSTAVGDHNGVVFFYTDDAAKKLEWGGSIVQSNEKLRKKAKVRLKRLSTFVNNAVTKRKVPRPKVNSTLSMSPSVLMKMDIEGSELEVLADLIVTGSMNGGIGTVMVEFHDWLTKDKDRKSQIVALKNGMKTLQDVTGSFRLFDLDDETYGTSDFPLPNCVD